MISFTRIQSSALYVADSNQQEGGWWGIISNNEPPPTGSISLKEALEKEQWAFNFVYVASGPYPGASGNPEEFIKKIRGFVNQKLDKRVRRRGALVFLKDGSTEGFSPESLETYLCIYLYHGTVLLWPDEGGVPDKKVDLTGVTGAELDIKFQLYDSTLKVSEQGDSIEINNYKEKPVATLDGKFAPTIKAPPANAAQLHFAGPARGAFTFALHIDQTSLYDKTNWGFQISIPNVGATAVARVEGETPHPLPGEKNGLPPYVSAWLPLAEKGAPGDVLGFTAQVNLVNPRNQINGAARTVFFFDGNATETALLSYYRTNYGKKIKLIPLVEQTDSQCRAGLVINAGSQPTKRQNGFRFAPVGDFVLAVDGAKAGMPEKMLCGLSGTETIGFLPQIDKTQVGTRLRFVSNQPANIPQFPLKAVSPVGPPIDPKADLLDSTYETSWASVVDPARSAHYSAAPKDAELFGKDTSEVEGLLGPEEPGAALPGDGSVVFPLFPIAGFQPGDGIQDPTSDQLELLSRQIISPTRKSRINSANAKSSPSAHVSLFAGLASAAVADDGLTSTTTPTGFITRYKKSDGTWKQLLLSQVQDGSVTQQMGFTGLKPDLQSAFQTSDQFLIVANNKYLGTPASGAFMPPSRDDDTTSNSFYNSINIGKWNFEIRTGQDNNYGDYRSVVIVKGVKGKIFDIDATGKISDDSLVLSPDKWTMKDKFAAPNPPDLSELVTLSNWLVAYCQDAYAKKENAYFANFVKIIQDENWTGVLILKAAIANIPNDLAGILAGVKDPSDFYAHHIGIEVGQIDVNKVEQAGSTSMFGLIYYVDPRFDASLEPPHPVAPRDSSAPYDFSLLTLKALFQNSAIKKFESLAQMVLNQIFGGSVIQMVDEKPASQAKPATQETNLYNAVLLEGGVQKNGDAVVYSLSSKWPNRYSLANNVLASVEIDTAQMSTRDDGSTSGQAVSWIGMSGFMNFAVIPAIKAEKPEDSLPAFDIFSFGPDEGQDNALRQGLNFNSLGLKITTPLKKDGVDPPPPNFELVDSELTFNASGSHAREKSLYKSFQLELLGLVSGNAKADDQKKKSDPSSLGYLPVITQYKLRGVTSGAGGWHGLKFKLNLGTPGTLAGKVNLDSSLLVAWADDSGAGGVAASADFQALVGIELPGTGSGGDLFSLQTVIKLSIGAIQLLYTPPVEGDKSKTGGFLLVLNEIALKLFGLLKIPPSGNTAFLLFGNPEATDSTGLGWFAMYKQDSKKNSGA